VFLPLTAAVVIVATTAPAAGARSDVDAPAAARPGPTEVRPTIQYEEALAHAHDRIPFVAGERVKVAFAPRRSDRWQVDGVAPRALPPGRLTGKAIRQSPTAPKPVPNAWHGRAGSSPDGVQTMATSAPIGAIDSPIADSDAGVNAELAAAVDPGGLRREVFGFLPYWELTDSSTRLDWEKLSTIAYFGIDAAANGDLQRRNSDGSTTVGWSGWTSSKLTAVINAAHAHGTRVVLTLQSFAWTSGQLARQKAMLGSAAARANLARQVAAAVRDRGADGVNLDFEPIASGYADEFALLTKSIRSELNRYARGYQLTFDTTGWIGNYPIQAATGTKAADAVVVMGYDYRTGGTSRVGSVAPTGGPSYDIRDTIAAYLSRIPAWRVILAVPYYGRAWATDSSSLNARNISSTKYGASTTVVYGTAAQYAKDHGRRYDPVEAVAWTAYKRQNCTGTYGCVTPWRQIYYDDVRALGAKYDLVSKYNLRGVGIWALGYDGTRPELYQLLKDKFITDTVPPAIRSSSLSAGSFSPNGDRRQDTVTMNVSVTGHLRFGYAVQPYVDNAAGRAVRLGTVESKNVTYTWDGRRANGARLPDGAYRIWIWAMDASNNRASAQKVVTIDTRPAVITSSVSPASISPNGDRRDDTTRLRMASDSIVTGRARIIGPGGATVRVWAMTAGRTGSWTWDGRNASGAIVPDRPYTFRLEGFDAARNRTVVDTPVRVDRTIGSLAWSASSFRPAGGTSRVSFGLVRKATVSVAIYKGSTYIRTIWRNKSAAAGTYHWTWDGRTRTGARVPAGVYRAVVTATSWIGTSSASRPVTVAK
jgi:spore germination protein YaaH/flagellar hook assembly protein FlgD